MKSIIQRVPVAAAFGLAMVLVAAPYARSADKPSSVKRGGMLTVTVTNTQNYKKEKIRLFASSSEQQVLCTMTGLPGKVYQLFVFDTYSHLVSQVHVRNGETAALVNISRGSYLFEVLQNDEHIEAGELTVK